MAIKRKIKGELEDDELEVVEKSRAETNKLNECRLKCQIQELVVECTQLAHNN